MFILFTKKNHPAGKVQDGTDGRILLRKQLKHSILQPSATNYQKVTSVALNNYGNELNLAAIYCPPCLKITEN